MHTRRAFLGSLAAAAAAFALDPERALWVPGAKTISIPKPGYWRYLKWDGCLRWFDGSPYHSGDAIQSYFRELERQNVLMKIGDTIYVPRPVRHIPLREWERGVDLFAVTVTPDLARDLDLKLAR